MPTKAHFYTQQQDAAAPTVASVSPATGDATGGTAVTVSGYGFRDTSAVLFGADAATSVVVNAFEFESVAPPTITSIDPTSAVPEDSVSCFGTSYGGAEVVDLVGPLTNSTDIATTFLSSTQLQFNVPAGLIPDINVDVTVRNANGQDTLIDALIIL